MLSMNLLKQVNAIAEETNTENFVEVVENFVSETNNNINGFNGVENFYLENNTDSKNVREYFIQILLNTLPADRVVRLFEVGFNVVDTAENACDSFVRQNEDTFDIQLLNTSLSNFIDWTKLVAQLEENEEVVTVGDFYLLPNEEYFWE